METFRSHGIFVALFAALALGSSSLLATVDGQDDAKKPQLIDKAQYVGSSKCKNCHKAAEKGEIYDKWSKGPHAKAFETLGTPAAKEAAAAVGIEDPQKAAECLKCHVTGHGADPKKIKRSLKQTEGISCESCHGPGSEHVKSRMKAAMSGKAESPGVNAAGLPLPLEIPAGEILFPTKDTCVACHNTESPTYKEFHLKERLPKVRHWNPAREKPRWIAEGEKYPAADTGK